MAQILYRYLHAACDPVTGLPESFPHSGDPELHGVAFTYDLALTALVFSHQRSLEESGRIAEFFRSMPLPTPATPDFNTAYDTHHCLPALEQACHLGPMAWAAIALMRHGEASRQGLYLQKALAILEWAHSHLPHCEGGVAMGLAAPWSERFSVENNWAYYAALRLATRRLLDGPVRERLLEERRGVWEWLSRHAGRRGGGADATKALDVYTNALLIGPEAYLEEGAWPDAHALGAWAARWIEELEALFRVPGSAGYDYTDAVEAARADRPRVTWLEGTEQVALAYQTWARFFETLKESGYAQRLLRRAALAHAAVIRSSLLVGPGVAIPNTDAPEPCRSFSDGWIARPWSEAALNGTTWAYFVETGFNPFLHDLPRS